MRFQYFLSQHPLFLCTLSPNPTPRDGNCLFHGKIISIKSWCSNDILKALIDGILHNDAFKHTRNEGKQESWTALIRDLKLYDHDINPVMYLRKRLVLGASQWLSGLRGSKENEQTKFGYTDTEWQWIWSLMAEDGAWAVPAITDSNGRHIKENYAPEMLIRYAAHEFKCHIIVFDLQLMRIQFCSGN